MIYIKNHIVTKLTNNIVNLVTSFAKRVYIPVLRNKEWGEGIPWKEITCARAKRAHTLLACFLCSFSGMAFFNGFVDLLLFSSNP